jgi:hypothetical protein
MTGKRRHPHQLRRRNPAAEAVRSRKFRPKVFRDRTRYHRPASKRQIGRDPIIDGDDGDA